MMAALAALALRAWSVVRRVRVTWSGALIVALALGLVWQTVRINGVDLLLIHWPGLSQERDAARQEAAKERQASIDAKALWRQAVLHEESQSRLRAAMGDTNHANELARARAAAAAFAADHRVRGPADLDHAGGTAAPASPVGPGLRETLPAGSILVSERDLQACTDGVAYAISLHNWLVDQPSVIFIEQDTDVSAGPGG